MYRSNVKGFFFVLGSGHGRKVVAFTIRINNRAKADLE